MTISGNVLQALMTFIIGGGLAALVTQLVRGWSSLRTGARASTREVIKDLAAARDEAEEREASLRRDKDYWRGVAGDYGYQLRQAGVLPSPSEPMSPSELRREGQNSPRRRRAQRAPTTDEIKRVEDGQ